MSVTLARPQGDSYEPDRDPTYATDWYQERREDSDEPVDLYLPLFQGDVFVGTPLDVPLTNVPQDELLEGAVKLPDAVMLVGHPCSMVAGSRPREYLETVRVRPTRFLHYDKYDTERYSEFPLPFLDPAHSGVHYSACLHERSLVRTADLDPRNRIAALSLDGVLALQQRITNESSRVRMSQHLLREQTQPRWHENQLARQWNDSVLARHGLDHDELVAALAVEADLYDKALSAARKAKDEESGYVISTTLRNEMFDLRNEGRVSIAVGKLIKARAYEVKMQRKLAMQKSERLAQEQSAPTAAAPEPGVA